MTALRRLAVLGAVVLGQPSWADGMVPPPRCEDACLRGDPIDTGARRYHHRLHVARVAATPRDLDLAITFTSRGNTWSLLDNLLHEQLLQGVPKPFGGDHGEGGYENRSMFWSHNWFAFVADQSNLVAGARYDTYAMVRDTRTEQSNFGAGSHNLYAPEQPVPDCVPTTIPGAPAGASFCWQGAAEFAPATPGRLLRGTQSVPGGGEPKSVNVYLHHQPDGTVEIYGTLLRVDARGDLPERTFYFLSEVRDAADRVTASVAYEQPRDAVGQLIQGCARGRFSWAPYISTVTSFSGPQLDFRYKKVTLPRPFDGLADECVLDEVRAGIQGQQSPGPVVGRFGYSISPHRQLATVRGNAGSEDFFYTFGGGQTFLRYRGGSKIAEYRSIFGNLISEGRGMDATASVTPVPVDVVWHGLTLNSSTQEVPRYLALDGASGSSAGYKETLHIAAAKSNLEQRPFVWREEHSCTAPLACSPGSLDTWVISKQPFPETAHVAGKKDKRDNWVMTPMRYSTPSAGTASVMPVRELLGEYRGVPDGDVANAGSAEPDTWPNALESETYEWRYSELGHQQKSKVKRASVVDGTEVETEYRYDGSRLMAVLETGKTKLFSDETVVTRVRATFFKTTRECIQNGADPFNRTVRIEGPCFLTQEQAATATSCGAGEPVVELVYFTGASRPEDSGRLKSAWQFPRGVGDCTSALSTEYSNYTAAGDPQSVKDPNGAEQVLTWGTGSADIEGQRLLSSRTIVVDGQSRTWRYTWENHTLTSVEYPEGNREVFCYRKGTRPGACAGGSGFAWSEQLQWQAKCDAAGTNCPESIVYSYWPDFTLRERAHYSGTYPNQQLRRREGFASDAHKRLTIERAGSALGAGGEPAVSVKRAYDASDNLAAIGAAANVAPDFCFAGANEQPSRLCTWLTWDRANRLKQVEFHPDSEIANDSKTCVEYDSRGNIRRQNMGCSEASSCEADRSGNSGIVACNPAWVDYEWDDFDSVIRVHFPWTGKTDNSRGTLRQQFDAMGNVIVRQNEEMRASAPPVHLKFHYDAMGRLRELVRASGNGQGPPSGPRGLAIGRLRKELLLYRLTYDITSMGEQGCPVLTNTKGRLALREDSFGKTGYVYNEEGQVRREVRIRFGQSGCGGGTAFADKNPDTFYAYTGNGDLQSITYPHGRRVLYQHNFANGSGRVESIIAEVFNGLFTVSVMLVNEVAWEPYGALRAYRLAPSGMVVEYLLAGGLETDAVGSELSCALLQASGAPATDGSGRLRGLYVSGAGATLGAPDGQVMKQVYRWKGDMLEKQWTCHRNTAGLPQLMTYAHDGTQRMLSATAGGNGASEAFSFAGAEGRRGNRTRATSTFTGMDAPCTQDYFSLASAVGGQPHQQDLLDAVQWGWAHGGSTCNTGDIVATGRYDWEWDRDGRRTRLSDATGLYVVTTGYEQTRLGAGLDSVIHTATISGGSYHGGNYTYFYDAFGRRRAKRLPWWERGDEYFHDVSGQLLSDRGVNSIGSTPTEYPEVDYVWLGGRPVVAIQGKFAIDSRPEVESMVRQPDVLGDCTRNGQPQACGVKYIVTDYIGKPVLVLDRADAFEPKIAAVGSYTAFGYANRFPFFYGSRHYQAARRNPEGCEPLGLDCAAVSEPVASFSAGLPAPEGWDANVRVLLHRSQGTVAGFENRPFFTLNGALQSMGDWAHRWSGFVSSSSGDYTLDYVGNTASYGLDTEAVEIRVKESAAQWWFPNLRFPGQYFDEETELHENWNRYYDPGTGRYLSSEPLLQDPFWTVFDAKEGRSMPPYAYAYNNPIGFIDPDGLKGAIPGGGSVTGPWVGNQNAVQNRSQTGPVQTFPWRRSTTTRAAYTPWVPKVVPDDKPSAEFPFRPGPGKCFEDAEDCIDACWDQRIHNTALCNQFRAAGEWTRYYRCLQGAQGFFRECMVDCEGR